MEISGTDRSDRAEGRRACAGAAGRRASDLRRPCRESLRPRGASISPARGRGSRSRPRPSRSRFSPPGTHAIARRWRPETASWSLPRPAESGRPCCNFFASGAPPRWRSSGPSPSFPAVPRARSRGGRPVWLGGELIDRTFGGRPDVVFDAVGGRLFSRLWRRLEDRRPLCPLRLRGRLRRARSREMDGRPGASRDGLPLALRGDPVLPHSDRLQSLASSGPLRRAAPGRGGSLRDVEGGPDSSRSWGRGSTSSAFPTRIGRSPAGRRPARSSSPCPEKRRPASVTTRTDLETSPRRSPVTWLLLCSSIVKSMYGSRDSLRKAIPSLENCFVHAWLACLSSFQVVNRSKKAASCGSPSRERTPRKNRSGSSTMSSYTTSWSWNDYNAPLPSKLISYLLTYSVKSSISVLLSKTFGLGFVSPSLSVVGRHNRPGIPMDVQNVRVGKHSLELRRPVRSRDLRDESLFPLVALNVTDGGNAFVRAILLFRAATDLPAQKNRESSGSRNCRPPQDEASIAGSD